MALNYLPRIFAQFKVIYRYPIGRMKQSNKTAHFFFFGICGTTTVWSAKSMADQFLWHLLMYQLHFRRSTHPGVHTCAGFGVSDTEFHGKTLS
jgi:hypothetical protein